MKVVTFCCGLIGRLEKKKKEKERNGGVFFQGFKAVKEHLN